MPQVRYRFPRFAKSSCAASREAASRRDRILHTGPIGQLEHPRRRHCTGNIDHDRLLAPGIRRSAAIQTLICAPVGIITVGPRRIRIPCRISRSAFEHHALFSRSLTRAAQCRAHASAHQQRHRRYGDRTLPQQMLQALQRALAFMYLCHATTSTSMVAGATRAGSINPNPRCATLQISRAHLNRAGHRPRTAEPCAVSPPQTLHQQCFYLQER